MGLIGHYDPADYWEAVVPEAANRIVLEPEEFYLLLSAEAVRVPPAYAAEMSALDPSGGEVRTHYAGFFDPGFGHDPAGLWSFGSHAALEIRAHDVPFAVDNLQRVCKLRFERMAEEPTLLYGTGRGSHYQGQVSTLPKHFRIDRGADQLSNRRSAPPGAQSRDDAAHRDVPGTAKSNQSKNAERRTTPLPGTR